MPTLRLGVNARLLRFPDVRGWNRYTVDLLAELPALDIEPILYLDAPIHEAHLARLGPIANSVRISPKLPYPAWEQGWLPLQAGRDQVDVLHSPINFGLPWLGRCPKVLTLHDAIDLAYYGGHRGRGAIRSRLHHWVARTRADRVITISEHARHDLFRLLGLSPSQVVVIPQAADARFSAAVPPAEVERVRRVHGIVGPYLFYVGGWEERKNVPFLVHALATAGVEGLSLVLAGGKQSEVGPILELARSLGVSDQVRPIGFAPEPDLPALYAGALAFLCPSRYEGFGLPLVEAMSAGCPTFAARATSLPEVLGDGGEMFGLESPDELAGLIRKVAADPEFRSNLIQRAQSRSRAFSWRTTAERTAAVYRELVARSRP